MRKLLILFFLIITTSAPSYCQFGIKAGVNLSYVNGNDDIVTSRASKVGFQGGLMYKIFIKDDWLSIQPELAYIQKGGTFDIDTLNITANLDYVELPVMCVFNVLGGIINFHAGPQFSFLSSVNYTVSEANGSTNDFNDTDLNNFNIFDFGLALGVGAELENVMIELRSSFGFISIEKGFEYNGQMYNPSSKNLNIQFIASYLF